jgi:uncharacterized lipoprotein YajG
MEKYLMKLGKQRAFLTLFMVLVLFAGGCTPKPFLKVQYQLPPPSNNLKGEKAALTVLDLRENRTFLTEAAKNSLKEFNETFSLVVLRDDGSGNLIGVYDFRPFLTEVFQQRLENEGVQVSEITDTNALHLTIEVSDFKLDVVGRKWIVRMDYRAELSDSGSLLSKESVSGQAERLKLRAKSDAEKILGELLTDMVNKLNIVRLFQQARQ